MFGGIGPLIPTQLSPVGHGTESQEEVKVEKLVLELIDFPPTPCYSFELQLTQDWNKAFCPR